MIKPILKKIPISISVLFNLKYFLIHLAFTNVFIGKLNFLDILLKKVYMI